MKTITILAASALLLCGCASSGMHEGMVYRDGSWYSPAADGRGDYYTSSPRYEDGYDYPFGFGIGVVPWGGYCPVRYRSCVTPWAGSIYYDPFYDPYWYQPWIYRLPPPRHQHLASPRPLARRGMRGEDELPSASAREPAPTARPRPWDERPAPARRSGVGERGSRRRAGLVDGG